MNLSKYINENYNYIFAVLPFFNKNKDILIKNGIINNKDEVIDFINKIKFTPEKIKLLNDNMMKIPCTIETVHKGQLCVSASNIKRHIPNLLSIKNSECNIKYFDENLNKYLSNETMKGAMSFTTCHDTEKTKSLSFDCNYNVSFSSAFLGISELYLGKLSFYRTKNDLKVFVTNLSNDTGRYKTELLYTRMLLGDNYKSLNFDVSQLGFNGCGFSQCLPQKFIYFFIDLYNEERYLKLFNNFNTKSIQGEFEDYISNESLENDYPTHNGIIIPDTPSGESDDILKFKIIGVELRIYNAHRYCNLDKFFYKDKIYSIDKFKMHICKEFRIILDRIMNLIKTYNIIINTQDKRSGSSKRSGSGSSKRSDSGSSKRSDSGSSKRSDSGSSKSSNSSNEYDKIKKFIKDKKKKDLITNIYSDQNMYNIYELIEEITKKKISKEEFISSCDKINNYCHMKDSNNLEYKKTLVIGGYRKNIYKTKKQNKF
jgi:hypothetical protein